jgi:hypothetical protein
VQQDLASQAKLARLVAAPQLHSAHQLEFALEVGVEQGELALQVGAEETYLAKQDNYQNHYCLGH